MRHPPLSDRPIQQAVDAIIDAVNRDKRTDKRLPRFFCAAGWVKSDLEEMMRRLTSLKEDERMLLVPMPNESRERGRYLNWLNLLGSVLRQTRAGVVPRSLEDTISSLRHFDASLPISSALARPMSENLNMVPRETPESADGIREARERTQSWATIERLSEVDHTPVFSRLAGGVRPLVLVFDDYNNYIRRNKDGSFSPIKQCTLPDTVLEKYGHNLERFLNSHCKNLNNLSIVFEVLPYKLWIGNRSSPIAEKIVHTLPLELLTQRRDAIGAILVDLEWEPISGGVRKSHNESREKDLCLIGYGAIRLLSLRYPEIPVFTYTGHWSEEKLMEALANGAHWCFFKDSHHGYSGRDRYELTSMELEHHLQASADAIYGSFSESPFPQQLMIDTGREVDRRLIRKLALRPPLERDFKWTEMRRMVAKLFPNGEHIRVAEVFNIGKSKAQATFVVRPFSNEANGAASASRFLKVAPWLEIQREYLAYQRTIRPRISSNVAHIVEPPVLTRGIEGGMPLAMLMYSMAGLPEDYENLRSLDQLLRTERSPADMGSQASTRLFETLEHVNWPLYGKTTNTDLATVRRPLWGWLGEVLPPVFTGVLVPLDDDEKKDASFIVHSWQRRDYKDNAAWLLAARDTRKLEEKATKGPVSPWRITGMRIRLIGFHLMEVEWHSDKDVGQITLAHPDLGWRVRLHGKADDIRRRFGANWLRSGTPVDVTAVVDATNRETERIRQKLRNALEAEELAMDTPLDALSRLPTFSGETKPYSFPDPFEWFGGRGGVPYSFTISAKQSPVHGDLNLNNLLFATDSGPGWLIDFKRATSAGMPAFDLGKLEAEIWHHHLFPVIEDVARSASQDKAQVGLQLLYAALKAADADSNNAEVFLSLVRNTTEGSGMTDTLLDSVSRLLDAIVMVRLFGRRRLKLSRTELYWALSAYFFSAIKFASSAQYWRAIFSYCTSAWYLDHVHPIMDDQNARPWERPFRRISEGGATAADERYLDGLLIRMSDNPKMYDLHEFTAALGDSPNGKKFAWPENTERWDIASTGSITNITPILGYLWLMARAKKEKVDGKYHLLVPKISSTGSSGGTVDILESGGLRFPGEVDMIVEACLRDGGVLCKQDTLTPIDKALMKRRKSTNMMKNAALVYASVLAKKIALGCTHAVIDVKVGRDGKVLTSGIEDEDLQAMITGVERGNIHPNVAENFVHILKAMGVDDKRMSLETAGEGFKWVRQRFDKGLAGSSVKEVRWFFTNADMPQCRTIGRQLSLLHLDDLIMGTYGERLLDSANQYERLFLTSVPMMCGIDPKETPLLELREQWQLLKADMLRVESSVLAQFFQELKELRKFDSVDGRSELVLLAPENFEKNFALSENENLHVLTFSIGPYQPQVAPSDQVEHLDAWHLDGLFDWLCGEEPYDSEVGIYLHCLPGEKMDNPAVDPFISICYRPSRCPTTTVIHKVRQILCEGVTVN